MGSFSNNIKVISDKLYFYRQNNAGANRVRYSGKVPFDKKWLSSFIVTKKFREMYNTEQVSVACDLHEVREASIVLRSMAAGGYKGEEYTHLVNIIKKNASKFYKCDDAGYTQKISVLLTSISPKLELKIWKFINRV